MVTRVNGSTYELKNVEGSHEPFQLLTMSTAEGVQGTTDSELVDVLIDRFKFKNPDSDPERLETVLKGLEAIKVELAEKFKDSDPELDSEESEDEE